tara:strand:- start:260 stop:505 length:246 start_codon:yes stop_codon:yes gene_type:complete
MINKRTHIQVKARRTRRSLGEMISTACFFILGAVLALQSFDFIDAGSQLRGYALLVCSCASFLGGCRFLIADAIDWLRKLL